MKCLVLEVMLCDRSGIADSVRRCKCDAKQQYRISTQVSREKSAFAWCLAEPSDLESREDDGDDARPCT